MSKYSSFKQGQMLFENWRNHINEAEMYRKGPEGLEQVDMPSEAEPGAATRGHEGAKLRALMAANEYSEKEGLDPKVTTDLLKKIADGMRGNAVSDFWAAVGTQLEEDPGESPTEIMPRAARPADPADAPYRAPMMEAMEDIKNALAQISAISNEEEVKTAIASLITGLGMERTL